MSSTFAIFLVTKIPDNYQYHQNTNIDREFSDENAITCSIIPGCVDIVVVVSNVVTVTAIVVVDIIVVIATVAIVVVSGTVVVVVGQGSQGHPQSIPCSQEPSWQFFIPSKQDFTVLPTTEDPSPPEELLPPEGMVVVVDAVVVVSPTIVCNGQFVSKSI